MLTLQNFKPKMLTREYTFSQVSYDLGRALVKRYGLYASIRYLKNLGFPIESTIEYLCFQPKGK